MQPHLYESYVRQALQYNRIAARQFEECLNRAKYWRRYEDSYDDVDDAFSNAINTNSCIQLEYSLANDPELLQLAFTCIYHYRQ